MNEHLLKLLQVAILSGTIIFIAVSVIPNFYSKPDNTLLQKEKLEYQLQIQKYQFKVDSLEYHIKNLETKKQENISIGYQKKKQFKELNPSHKVLEFNKLFNQLSQ